MRTTPHSDLQNTYKIPQTAYYKFLKLTILVSLNLMQWQNPQTLEPGPVSGLRWWSPSLTPCSLMNLDPNCRYKTQINVYCHEMTSQDLRSEQIYRCSTTPPASPLPQLHIAKIKTTLNASVPCSHFLSFIYLVGCWKHKLLLSCVLLECKLFSM